MKLVYGPVPSRRFGISLGIDVIPFKVCTLNCAYCQLGHTTRATAERSRFVEPDEVVAQVREALAKGPKPDIITFAGSGEPTLYAALGELADMLRREFAVPLLLITNGTLLHRTDVAEEAARFDIVAPSLDAGDEATFRTINRPAPGITFDLLVDGLKQFAHAYPDKMRLEVFFAAGINDDPASVAAIVDTVAHIGARRVELNTAVRPTADSTIRGVSAQFLADAASIFPCEAVPIASPPRKDAAVPSRTEDELEAAIFSTLSRRPCTAEDLATSLAEPLPAVARALDRLLKQGAVVRDEGKGATFYRLESLDSF